MFIALAAATSFLLAQRAPVTLFRKYVDGQKIAYRMTGLNEDPEAKRTYTAQVEGLVRQDPAGFFYEDLWWTNAAWGKHDTRFLPEDAGARQTLSLDPKAPFKMPDLSRVPGDLIGPMTDLITFYVDLLLPIRSGALKHVGDHFYVPFGRPSSWADGKRVKIGLDAIDFDVSLQKIDLRRNTVEVVVKHVPPKRSTIAYPADWMKDSGHGTPSNWIEVSHTTDGKWKAAYGKETFDVSITVNLETGEILKAIEENIVEVTQRECGSESLSNPGPPTNYRIHRRITIQPEQ